MPVLTRAAVDVGHPAGADSPAVGPRTSDGTTGLRAAVVMVGLLVALAAALGLPARAAPGAQTVADEPQYLLSATSLYHQHDLNIAEDLAAEKWRAYSRADLPQQTAARADGQRLSPHDPLLPTILAIPMGLGGWLAAKATLALLAGVLAGLLVWTAVRRFAVPVPVAALVVAAFGVVPPLVTYGSQVYPELPAALVATIAVAAITGPLDRRGRWTAAVAIAAMPWLAVKYVPVAAALFIVLALTLWRRGARKALTRTVVLLGLAGGAYLAFHRMVYGGWTVYAAGDHFTAGELSVVGTSPDYPARAVRLVGLLTDHDFGLLAWAPAYLFAVPALAALARRRPRGAAALALPLAAGWLNATFVALTMHGWWWPGRQVVVVLPLAVLAVAWWAGRVVNWVHLRPWLLVATGAGLIFWFWLLVEVFTGQRSLIVDFAQTANPVSKAWRLLLPDDRVLAPVDLVRQTAWIVAFAAAAIWSWRRAAPEAKPADRGPSSSPPLQDQSPVPERTPA